MVFWSPADPRQQYSNVYEGYPAYLTEKPTRQTDRLIPCERPYNNFRILDVLCAHHDGHPVHWVYLRCLEVNRGLIARIGFSHVKDGDWPDYPCWSDNLDWLPEFYFDDSKYAVLDFLQRQYPDIFPEIDWGID